MKVQILQKNKNNLKENQVILKINDIEKLFSYETLDMLIDDLLLSEDILEITADPGLESFEQIIIDLYKGIKQDKIQKAYKDIISSKKELEELNKIINKND